MLTIQKNRRACDRCHSQKLSCKRETIDGPCMRCFRAKAFCSITPKPKRSRQWSISGSNTRGRKSQSQFTDLEVRGLHLGHDSACGDENLIYDDDVLCLHEDPHMAVPDFSNDIFGIGKESESMYNGSNGEENFADDVTRKTKPWGNQFFDNRPRLSGYQAHHMEPSDLLDPVLFNPVETLGSLTNDVHSDGHTSPSLSPPLTPDDLDFEFLHGTSRSGATQFSHKAYARHGSPVTKVTPMHCPPGVILDDSMPHANSRGSNEWIEMVTQLNIRLYEHYSATEYPAKCIPGQLESRAPPSSSAYAPGSQLGSVDETFTLSQQLLDIYSQGVSSASIPARVSSLRLHGKMREEASYRQLGYSSAMLGNAVKGNQESQQAHDPASLLLLLSCRLRLLHIYQNLLRHLQDWLTEKPSSLQQNNTHVPTLSIGSFSLGSLPTLQVTVIIQLMEHFLSQLQQISKCVLPDRSSDVADITLGAIKKNEAEALQTLRRVKQMINMI